MKPSDVTDRINDLMDVARAGAMRCAGTATLARSPAFRARLLLAAAQYQAEAGRLHRLVVEWRGTPHAGDTDAILADPIWWSPPDESIGDDGLLALCLDEQQCEIDRLRSALDSAELPASVRPVLMEVADAAAARQRQLGSALQDPVGGAPMAAPGASPVRTP